MPTLDFAIQSRLFAIPFRLIVLLPLFEEPMRGVVTGGIFRGVCSVLLLDLWHCTIARMQLLEKLAVSFGSVLALGVVLRALLYAVTILHQPYVLPITVSLSDFGKPEARLQTW